MNFKIVLELEKQSEPDLIKFLDPERLELDSEGHIIFLDLSYLSLPVIPKLKLPYLQKLDLSSNKIQILENINYPLQVLNLYGNDIIYLANSFYPLKIKKYHDFRHILYLLSEPNCSVDPRPYFEFLHHPQLRRKTLYVPKPSHFPTCLDSINPSELEIKIRKKEFLTDLDLEMIQKHNFQKGISDLNCQMCLRTTFLRRVKINFPFLNFKRQIHYNLLKKLLTLNICYECHSKYTTPPKI